MTPQPDNTIDELDQIIADICCTVSDNPRYRCTAQKLCTDCQKDKLRLLSLIREARVEELTKVNNLMRSIYEIACREYALDGENTNWSPFITQLRDELDRQHKMMYPAELEATQPKGES